MIGPLIPFIRHDLAIGYGAAGLLFSAQSIGSIAVLLVAGWLVHRQGVRWILNLGSIGFALGLAVSSLAPSVEILLAGNVLIGIGMSLWDVGISTSTMDATSHGKGKALNLLHFFFGAGAVAGPLAAWIASDHWRLALGVLAVVPLGLLVLINKMPVPATPSAPSAVRFGVYRKPLLWLIAVALSVYCGVEWGVGAWFPSYWVAAGKGVDPNLVTSLFWLTFSLGRFFVGGLADRWGFGRFLGLALAASGGAILLWLLSPTPEISLLAVLLLGVALAGIYPTFVALASQRFPASSGQVASVLSIFAGLGTLLWPPLMGVWADVHRIQSLPVSEFGVWLVLALVGAVTLWKARESTRG